MGYFITVPEIMQKYGIREKQIVDTIKSDNTLTVYDKNGIALGRYKLSSIVGQFDSLPIARNVLLALNQIGYKTHETEREHDSLLNTMQEFLFIPAEFDRVYKAFIAPPPNPAKPTAESIKPLVKNIKDEMLKAMPPAAIAEINSLAKKMCDPIAKQAAEAFSSAQKGKKQPIEQLSTLPQAAESPRNSYALSAAEMGTLCGRSARTIQNWEKGKGKPADYPGREDLTEAQKFAARYNGKEEQKKIVHNMSMKRAVSGGDVAGTVMRHRDDSE